MRQRLEARRGFTLIETMVVVVFVGLVVLVAMPRIRESVRRQNLRNGVNTVAGLYAQARTVAVTRGAEARLMLTSDSAWVTVQTAGGTQVVGSVEPITERFGVVLGGTDSIRIGSTGIPIGIATRAPITVTKGSYAESLYVSRYGRME